ncbi:hypothetical protein EAI_00353 [Harpegnathos saltator]|uniref:Uncharacterized protein n=1 Tax=Harpegnathos saltator TaxID=610380 RepID=E2BSH6_HARSA|nr:hypothetical protein EAI_00353 [Harpegnathos saltator]
MGINPARPNHHALSVVSCANGSREISNCEGGDYLHDGDDDDDDYCPRPGLASSVYAAVRLTSTVA